MARGWVGAPPGHGPPHGPAPHAPDAQGDLMSFPLVRLHGTPYEQGRQHGEQLRDPIRRNLTVYFYRFQHEGRISRDEVLSRASRYLEMIEAQNPDYAAALRG